MPDTIAHNDLWVNNILFSIDSDGHPSKIKLLDFGTLTMGHPMCDIFHYVYMCAYRAFRQKHFDEIIKEYFNLYSKYLSGSEARFDQFTKGN
jgi:aminoglycoside phosphotransferase (APT) family kinase protein